MNSKELDIIRGVVDATPDAHIPNFNSIFDKDHSGLGTVPEIPTPGPTPGGDDDGGGAGLTGYFSPVVEVDGVTITINPLWLSVANSISQQSNVTAIHHMSSTISSFGGGIVFALMPGNGVSADATVAALRKLKVHLYTVMVGTGPIDTSNLELGMYFNNTKQVTIPADAEIVGDVYTVSGAQAAVSGCVRFDFTVYDLVDTLMTQMGVSLGDIVESIASLYLLAVDTSGMSEVTTSLPNFEITE